MRQGPCHCCNYLPLLQPLPLAGFSWLSPAYPLRLLDCRMQGAAQSAPLNQLRKTPKAMPPAAR